MRPFVAMVLTAALVSACHVSNRLYNPADPKLVEQSSPPERTVERPVAKSIVRVEETSRGRSRRIDRPDPGCQPAAGEPVCMAFVEFDEQGEFWDRRQPEEALELVTRAKSVSHSPIVVTFTHGWKNNADDRDNDENHNVVGFEGVLEFLRMRFANYPVVGVYLGWRGELVPESWPIGHQLSLFNREATAIRIPGVSMTSFLIRLMMDVHSDETPGAHLILVGHSFGALILERALTQAMTDYVLRQTPATEMANRARADLIVFVNSAAAASEAKQMLNFLKDQVSHDSTQSSQDDPLQRTAARPLFLSISSLGDIATRFGLPVGHALPFLGLKQKGSWRDYAESQAAPPAVTAQSAFYLSTTAHMEALQSHVIIDPASPTDVARCATDEQGSPKYFSVTPIVTTTGHFSAREI
jgi:alpha/beta hydrolase family protein